MHTKTSKEVRLGSLEMMVREPVPFWLVEWTGEEKRGSLHSVGLRFPLPMRKRTLGQKKKKSQLIEMPVGILPVTMFHFSAFISIIIPSDLFQKHQPSSRRVTGSVGRDLFLFLFPCKLSPWLRMPVSCLAQAHSLWEELQGLVRQRRT